MRHSVGLAYKKKFTVLATYCLPILLHPSGILDFGAPNPGRRHIVCSWRRVGGRLVGFPLSLEGRRCQPQQVGVVEARLMSLCHIPGVSAAEMAGC